MAPGGKGRTFKGKTSAQDAHEAVRPVDMLADACRTSRNTSLPTSTDSTTSSGRRFVASQMAAATYHDTSVSLTCGPGLWKAKGERLLFPGFLAVMPRSADEEEAALPALHEGEVVTLQKLEKEQKFTQPAPRYTEASLVRELEERGIGRPSTYATIISTIEDREYVRLEDKHFVPTDLGKVVCSQLRDHFARLDGRGLYRRNGKQSRQSGRRRTWLGGSR